MIGIVVLGVLLAQAPRPKVEWPGPAQRVPRSSTVCRDLTRKRCWRVSLAAGCRDAEAFRTVADDSARTDVNTALADCEASLSDHGPTVR
jgi:hypothetical protein